MMGKISLMATAADFPVVCNHWITLYAERLVSACVVHEQSVCVFTGVTFSFSRYSVVSVTR